MPEFLKGNYQLPDKPQGKTATGDSTKSLTERFEDSALAKLGGSICFVTKEKTLLWMGDESEKSGQ